MLTVQVDIITGATCLAILVTGLLAVWFLIEQEEREKVYEGKRRKGGNVVRRAVDWIRSARHHRFFRHGTHAFANS